MMWIITQDLLDPGSKYEGTCSMNCTAEVKAKPDLLPCRFRLKDDDGEVYYEGRSNDECSQDAFAPLDDFAQGNDGCTSIEYFHDGKWEVH